MDMLTAQAIKYFGTRYALAQALGISPATVYQWKERVPTERQIQLERLTKGALVFDGVFPAAKTLGRPKPPKKATGAPMPEAFRGESMEAYIKRLRAAWPKPTVNPAG